MLDLLIKFPIESSATIATIPAIVSFWYRAAFKHRIARYFFFYLVVKLCIELIMFYMASKGTENLYLGNMLTVISFFLFAKMFHDVYESPTRRKVIGVCELIFITVLSYDLVRDGMHYTFRYTGMFECIFVMLFCLMYFHELIMHPKIPNLLIYPFFWIVAGLLTYFSCCTFLSPMSFYLDRWPKNHDMYVFVLLPYCMETFYLSMITVGIFISKS